METRETTLFSQIDDLLAGKISPEFSVSCVDTCENRTRMIAKIANLYGYFLTYQAHEEAQCRKLQDKGMWLEIKTAEDYFPSPEQVHVFIQNLMRAMEVDLAKDREWGVSTKLGVDYGPDPGALFEAFQETCLDIRCNALLPYKSLTYLEIKGDQVRVNVWLKGPLL